MSYINKSVSIYGTEKDFIKAFVNELTSADSRIVCETDIDTEFANEDTSYNMRIALDVNNCYKLRLVRDVKSTNVYYWYMEQVINDVVTNGAKVYYADKSNSKGIDDLTTRSWKFIFASNDNAIAMIFGSYNSELPSSYNYNVFSYHEQDFNLVSFIPDESSAAIHALKAEMLRTDESNKGESYKIDVDRLCYSRGENIEIIESKVLFKNGIAEYDMKNVFDCSNVTAGNLLSFENNRYYALSSNTLILI